MSETNIEDMSQAIETAISDDGSGSGEHPLEHQLSGVCMCSICPEHPMFIGEEEFLVHYQRCHKQEENTEKHQGLELVNPNNQGVLDHQDSHSQTSGCTEDNTTQKQTLSSGLAETTEEGQSPAKDQMSPGYTTSMLICPMCEERTFFLTEGQLDSHIENLHQNENDVDMAEKQSLDSTSMTSKGTSTEMPDTHSQSASSFDETVEKQTLSTHARQTEGNLLDSDQVTLPGNSTGMLICPLCKERTFFLTEELLDSHIRNLHQTGDGADSAETKNENAGVEMTEKESFGSKLKVSTCNANDAEVGEKQSLSLDSVISKNTGAEIADVHSQSSISIGVNNLSNDDTMSSDLQPYHKNSTGMLICPLCDDKTFFLTKEQLGAHIESLHQNVKGVNKNAEKKSVSSKSILSKSSATLNNLYEQVSNAKREQERFDLEKQSLENDLGNLRLSIKGSGGSQIEKLLQREIDDLASCKYEQTKLLEELHSSIDNLETTVISTVKERVLTRPVDFDTRPCESDIKVAKWLQEQSDPESNTEVIIESVDKNVQTTFPDISEKCVQTGNDWIEDQEVKNNLIETMKYERESLTNLVQEKCSNLERLEVQIEGLRKSEMEVDRLEGALAKAKNQSEINLGLQRSTSRSELKKVELENEQLSRKLDERAKLIQDYKRETINLQKLCQDVRLESTTEKKSYEKEIKSITVTLNEKSIVVGELRDQIKALSEDNADFRTVHESLEKRKDQLILEMSNLKTAIKKYKDENQNFSVKVAQAKKIIREKTNNFNEKINVFLKNEKMLKLELKSLRSKYESKEDIVRQQITKIAALKMKTKEIEIVKQSYDEKLDDLKTAIRKEEKSREIVSEKFIKLEVKYKSICQENVKLEERQKLEHIARINEAESSQREIKKINEDCYDLRMKYDSVCRDHENCSKQRHGMEREHKYKEGKLHDDMECVLRETTSHHQKQMGALKQELCRLSDMSANQQSLESKVDRLTQENKELTEQMEISTRNTIEEKSKFSEQMMELEGIISSLKKEKENVEFQAKFLEQKAASCAQEAKEKKEEKLSEVDHYKDELSNVRATLREQLQNLHQLQEEKQNGGHSWQREQKELQKELELAKNKIRDCQIEQVVLQERCGKLSRDTQTIIEKRDVAEKSLHDLIDQEKKKVHEFQVRCSRDIQVWVQKHDELDKQNMELKKRIDDVQNDRDLKLVKCETSEQLAREESDKMRNRVAEAASTKERLENENRSMALDITKQEEQIRTLRKETVNQSDYVETMEKRLQDTESKKFELATSNSQLEEKLRNLENEHRRLKMDMLRCSTNARKFEDSADENKRLKKEGIDAKIEAKTFKEDLRIVEQERNMLTKQFRLSEEQQERLQQQAENLQFKLKEMSASTQEQLATSQEHLAHTRFNHKNEIHEKNERMSVLNEQIRGLQRSLSGAKSKRNNVEVEALRDGQKEMNKLTGIHENELKMKEIAMSMLKKEIKDLQERFSQYSTENVTNYQQEINDVLANHAEDMKTRDSEHINLKKQIEELQVSLKLAQENLSGKEDLKSRDEIIINLKKQIAELQISLELAQDNLPNGEVDKILSNYVEDLKSRDELIIHLKKQIEELRRSLKVAQENLADEKVDDILANHVEDLKSRDKVIIDLKKQNQELQELGENCAKKLSNDLFKKEREIEKLKEKYFNMASSTDEAAVDELGEYRLENGKLLAELEQIKCEFAHQQDSIALLQSQHQKQLLAITDLQYDLELMENERDVVIKEKRQLIGQVEKLSERPDCSSNSDGALESYVHQQAKIIENDSDTKGDNGDDNNVINEDKSDMPIDSQPIPTKGDLDDTWDDSSSESGEDSDDAAEFAMPKPSIHLSPSEQQKQATPWPKEAVTINVKSINKILDDNWESESENGDQNEAVTSTSAAANNDKDEFDFDYGHTVADVSLDNDDNDGDNDGDNDDDNADGSINDLLDGLDNIES